MACRLNSVDASETFVEEGENLMKRWPLAVRSPTLQHQIDQFLAQVFGLGQLQAARRANQIRAHKVQSLIDLLIRQQSIGQRQTVGHHFPQCDTERPDIRLNSEFVLKRQRKRERETTHAAEQVVWLTFGIVSGAIQRMGNGQCRTVK